MQGGVLNNSKESSHAIQALRIVVQHQLIPGFGWNISVLEQRLPILRSTLKPLLTEINQFEEVETIVENNGFQLIIDDLNEKLSKESTERLVDKCLSNESIRIKNEIIRISKMLLHNYLEPVFVMLEYCGICITKILMACYLNLHKRGAQWFQQQQMKYPNDSIIVYQCVYVLQYREILNMLEHAIFSFALKAISFGTAYKFMVDSIQKKVEAKGVNARSIGIFFNFEILGTCRKGIDQYIMDILTMKRFFYDLQDIMIAMGNHIDSTHTQHVDRKNVYNDMKLNWVPVTDDHDVHNSGDEGNPQTTFNTNYTVYHWIYNWIYEHSHIFTIASELRRDREQCHRRLHRLITSQQIQPKKDLQRHLWKLCLHQFTLLQLLPLLGTEDDSDNEELKKLIGVLCTTISQEVYNQCFQFSDKLLLLDQEIVRQRPDANGTNVFHKITLQKIYQAMVLCNKDLKVRINKMNSVTDYESCCEYFLYCDMVERDLRCYRHSAMHALAHYDALSTLSQSYVDDPASTLNAAKERCSNSLHLYEYAQRIQKLQESFKEEEIQALAIHTKESMFNHRFDGTLILSYCSTPWQLYQYRDLQIEVLMDLISIAIDVANENSSKIKYCVEVMDNAWNMFESFTEIAESSKSAERCDEMVSIVALTSCWYQHFMVQHLFTIEDEALDSEGISNMYKRWLVLEQDRVLLDSIVVDQLIETEQCLIKIQLLHAVTEGFLMSCQNMSSSIDFEEDMVDHLHYISGTIQRLNPHEKAFLDKVQNELKYARMLIQKNGRNEDMPNFSECLSNNIELIHAALLWVERAFEVLAIECFAIVIVYNNTYFDFDEDVLEMFPQLAYIIDKGVRVMREFYDIFKPIFNGIGLKTSDYSEAKIDFNADDGIILRSRIQSYASNWNCQEDDEQAYAKGDIFRYAGKWRKQFNRFKWEYLVKQYAHKDVKKHDTISYAALLL